MFLPLAFGFGVLSGPPPGKTRPEHAPVSTVNCRRSPQALLYRLNGDKKPLDAIPSSPRRRLRQADPARAVLFGIVLKAIVDAALDGDPTRVARYAVRFAGVAFPGETLRTSWWRGTASC